MHGGVMATTLWMLESFAAVNGVGISLAPKCGSGESAELQCNRVEALVLGAMSTQGRSL